MPQLKNNIKNISPEERMLLQLSRIDMSIRAVASAINMPYIFPKQEIVSTSDEFAKQFAEQREENRKDTQIDLLQKQNRILIYTLIVTGISVVVSAIVQTITLFIRN
jgi:hypothetical protein